MKGPKRYGWLVLVVVPLLVAALPLVLQRCSSDNATNKTTVISHGSASPAIVTSGAVNIHY